MGWNGDMLGWLEYVNMVPRWNGAMIFVLFYEWWNIKMENQLFWEKWWNNDMVKWSNVKSMFWGNISIDGDMLKYWNGEENQLQNE